MEAIARLVADSLARHGLDRSVDTRRLQWSRWTRCDSPHSLLVVPSKPGIFAIAEEIMDMGAGQGHVAVTDREAHDFSSEPSPSRPGAPKSAVLPATSSTPAAVADEPHATEVTRRMLAVLQFSEDDDMAFTLDRMFTRPNAMRARLSSGRCFVRFVIIQDQEQRRSICSALNQWMLSSAEKASGIPVGRTLLSDMPDKDAGRTLGWTDVGQTNVGRTLLSDMPERTSRNDHGPQPFPSGF